MAVEKYKKIESVALPAFFFFINFINENGRPYLEKYVKTKREFIDSSYTYK